jgi:hypothetical protein
MKTQRVFSLSAMRAFLALVAVTAAIVNSGCGSNVASEASTPVAAPSSLVAENTVVKKGVKPKLKVDSTPRRARIAKLYGGKNPDSPE